MNKQEIQKIRQLEITIHSSVMQPSHREEALEILYQAKRILAKYVTRDPDADLAWKRIHALQVDLSEIATKGATR